MNPEDKDRMRRRHERQVRRQEIRKEHETHKRRRAQEGGAERPSPREREPLGDEEFEWNVSRPRPRKPSRSTSLVGLERRSEDSLREGEFIAHVRTVHRTRLEAWVESEGTISLGLPIQRSTENLVVGDRIVVRAGPDGPRLTGRLERRGLLRRRDPSNAKRERPIAANVDQALITVSAKEPAWKPGVVERLLVLLARCSIRPLLVVNKVDLLSSSEREHVERDLERFSELGLETFLVSANVPEDLASLRAALTNVTSVLVGHSGVGKSSLINALAGARQRTNEVREHDGKGRHTTTSSRLLALPRGGLLIDTPGIRSIATWDTRPEDLRHLFPDFEVHARSCRFADCRHEEEPDCGVRRAVETGLLRPERHAAYLRIARSMEE